MSKQLTEQDILEASSYMSLEKKVKYSKVYADKCIDEYGISTNVGEDSKTMPPMFKENTAVRMILGLRILLSEYLHKIKEEDSFAVKDFDEWCESAVFNQLDRFKTSKNIEVKNKAYDIIDDYREFYRMLGSEINAVCECKNDLLARFIGYFDSQITPESMKQTMDDINEIKEFAEKREGKE